VAGLPSPGAATVECTPRAGSCAPIGAASLGALRAADESAQSASPVSLPPSGPTRRESGKPGAADSSARSAPKSPPVLPAVTSSVPRPCTRAELPWAERVPSGPSLPGILAPPSCWTAAGPTGEAPSNSSDGSPAVTGPSSSESVIAPPRPRASSSESDGCVCVVWGGGACYSIISNNIPLPVPPALLYK